MAKYEIKAQKAYIEKLANKKKDVENILPSPFITHYGKINKTYRIENDNILGKNFCIVSNLLSFVSLNWNNTALRIYLYILNNLKYNSNSIIITYKDFNNYYKINRATFIDGINSLTKSNNEHFYGGDSLSLLSRTTRKSLYIVNHNLLFKGNYDFFIENINIKYPNGCKLNSNGKVIIE